MLVAIEEGSIVALSSEGTHVLSRNDEIAVRRRLVRTDVLMRLNAPRDPPPLCLDSAVWAARTMYFLCDTMLNRVETQTDLPRELIHSEPAGNLVSHHWSVDLAFRVLADLDRRCGQVAKQDPLRQTIAALCDRWPFSGVGIVAEPVEEEAPGSTSVAAERISLILKNDCLRRMMVDRIISRGDAKYAKITPLTTMIASSQPSSDPLRPLLSENEAPSKP